MKVLQISRLVGDPAVVRGRLFLLAFCIFVSMELVSARTQNINASPRPSSVNLGALFTFDSIIGRAAKTAIELAVEDINSDSSILLGTRLNLLLRDTNFSGFLGTVEGTTMVISDYC